MKISLLKEEDIEDLVKLEKEVFSHSLGEDYFKLQLKNPSSYYILLKEDTELVGYIGTTIEEMSEIQNFCIRKDFQGYGYGDLLLSNALMKMQKENSKSVYLEVNSTNTRAINLYKKCGFEVDHIRKGYYDGVDAFVMIKKIGD